MLNSASYLQTSSVKAFQKRWSLPTMIGVLRSSHRKWATRKSTRIILHAVNRGSTCLTLPPASCDHGATADSPNRLIRIKLISTTQKPTHFSIRCLFLTTSRRSSVIMAVRKLLSNGSTTCSQHQQRQQDVSKRISPDLSDNMPMAMSLATT